MTSRDYNSDYILPFKPTIHYANDIYNIRFTNTKSIKMMYLNARSVNNKIEELQHILLNTSKLNNNKYIPIIALTEHWISSDNAPHFLFENYTTILSTRDKKRGGGSAIFIAKNQIKFDILLQYSDEENSITSIKLYPLRSQPFVLTCVYRAPNTNTQKIDFFFHTLTTHLESIGSFNSYCIGDFNINTLNDDTLTQRYLATMQSYGLFICDKSSITRPAAKTCIDHLHTNQLHQNIHLHYTSYDMLDHTMIFVELVNTTQNQNIQSLKQISVISQNHVNENINNNSHNIYATYEQFTNNLSDIIKKNTSIKYIKIINKVQKPWIDERLHKIIRSKNFWYNKLKSDPENLQIKNELKFWQNQVTFWRRKNRLDYFGSKFADNMDNKKKTWECINEVINNGQKPRQIAPILNNTTTDVNKKLILNDLNKYLAEMGKKLTDMYPSSLYYKSPQRLNAPFTFTLTTKNNIEDTINKLKNTSSTGYDKVNVKIFKLNKHLLSTDIKTIINSSLISGKVPATLKISKITPVHKGGDTKDFNNYRPISILPVIDKIMTKIINTQLLKYIEKHKILNKHQYGFILESNTSTALFDVVSTLQKHQDNKEISVAIFIDLQKAFDTVKRDLLLRKLWILGIRDKEYSWFKSYLSQRKQYIEIDGIASELQLVEEGVPQGGHLASTLFLLYINDITDINLNGTPFLYADDIALIYNHTNLESIQLMINSDMEKLRKWMYVHHLTLNTKKTKYMIISKKSNLHLDIKYNNISIDETSHFKYLGVIIDNKLNWNQQLQSITKKASSMAGIFKKISHSIPPILYKSIFYSLFHSNVTYGLIVWASTTDTKLKKIQTLQNRAIKNLFKYKRDERTQDIHKNNNFLTVSENIKYVQCNHIHNIINQCIHTNTTLTTAETIHSYTTRSANLIYQNNNRTSQMGLRSVLYKSIKTYNELPEYLKLLNKSKYKLELKKHILNRTS